MDNQLWKMRYFIESRPIVMHTVRDLWRGRPLYADQVAGGAFTVRRPPYPSDQSTIPSPEVHCAVSLVCLATLLMMGEPLSVLKLTGSTRVVPRISKEAVYNCCLLKLMSRGYRMRSFVWLLNPNYNNPLMIIIITYCNHNYYFCYFFLLLLHYCHNNFQVL